MELLLICAVIGCIPAAIASSKGRSFGLWWIYGALLFIVALIHSLCLKKDHKAIEQEQLSEGLVKCPYCAEMVKPEAIKCKHCGSELDKIITNQFNLSDVSPKSLYIPRKDGYELDRAAILSLVDQMKAANPSLPAESVMDKYLIEIKSIGNDIPKRIRDDFYQEIQKSF